MSEANRKKSWVDGRGIAVLVSEGVRLEQRYQRMWVSMLPLTLLGRRLRSSLASHLASVLLHALVYNFNVNRKFHLELIVRLNEPEPAEGRALVVRCTSAEELTVDLR